MPGSARKRAGARFLSRCLSTSTRHPCARASTTAHPTIAKAFHSPLMTDLLPYSASGTSPVPAPGVHSTTAQAVCQDRPGLRAACTAMPYVCADRMSTMASGASQVARPGPIGRLNARSAHIPPQFRMIRQTKGRFVRKECVKTDPHVVSRPLAPAPRDTPPCQNLRPHARWGTRGHRPAGCRDPTLA